MHKSQIPRRAKIGVDDKRFFPIRVTQHPRIRDLSLTTVAASRVR